MDEIATRLQTQEDLDRRLEYGRSALEQGDIEEARAVLREVYDVCPTHPSLPDLAAGIRRIRPKRVPWRRPALILVGVLVVIGSGSALLSRTARIASALPAQPLSSTVSVPDVAPPAPAAASSAPEVSASATQVSSMPEVASRATATASQVGAPALSEFRRSGPEAPVDEDRLISAAIARFESAYRSRWTALAFEHCDLARQIDTATAICRTREPGGASDADPDDVWTFRLQKSGDAWKIISVQPSPRVDHM